MTVDDMYAQMRRLLDRIRCAEIAREEAKRTVLVPGPASAVQFEAWLVAHGLDDVITVEMSRYLPTDTWIVMDVQAIEAGQAEALQQMARQPLFPTCGLCGAVNYGDGPMRHRMDCPIAAHLWAMTCMSPTSMIRVTGC